MKVIDFRFTVLLPMFICAFQHVKCSFSSQNQQCITSDQEHGTCQLAEDCTLSLTPSFDHFKTDLSFHLSDYLKANRGNCGIMQGVETLPLYCCEVQAPKTLPPTPTQTPTTPEAITDNFSCNDAKNRKGTCQLIKDCPHINEIFKRCNPQKKCTNLLTNDYNFLSDSVKACYETTKKYANRKIHVCCSPESAIENSSSTTEDPITELPTESSGTEITPITLTAPSDEDLKKLKYISLYEKLLPADCGKTPLDINDKLLMLGGNDLHLTEHPWLVALLYKNIEKNNKLEVECGGSMITRRHVLTAAHCLKPKVPAYVRIGEYQLSTDEDCVHNNEGVKVCNPKHLDIYVNRILVHDDYIKTEIMSYDDIGLIRLSKIIRFNSDQNNKKFPLVVPVCLPQIEREMKGMEIPDETRSFEVIGWGHTENGVMSDIKQSLKMKGFNRVNCSSVLNVALSDFQICAGGVKGEDTCKGDSGGPLLREPSGYDVPYYIDGVISIGKGCGREGMPGIYTRVSNYMEWILDTIEANK